MNIQNIFFKKNLLIARAISNILSNLSNQEKLILFQDAILELNKQKITNNLNLSFLENILLKCKKRNMNEIIELLLSCQQCVATDLNLKIAYIVYNSEYKINKDCINSMLSLHKPNIIQYIPSNKYLSFGFSIYYNNLTLHNNAKYIINNMKLNLFKTIDYVTNI